jgi:hypothetical protein
MAAGGGVRVMACGAAQAQRGDGSWYGSWGVCFTYAIWFGCGPAWLRPQLGSGYRVSRAQ